MYKLICIFILMGSTTSCSLLAGIDPIAIAKGGASQSDAVLNASVWQICLASPVGAVKRRFNTAELQAAYNTLCGNNQTLQVIPDE